MGVEVKGLEELKYRLRQGGDKAVKHAIERMRIEADDIRDLAKQMAPIDEGDLEEAIISREVAKARNAQGRFTQATLIVEVDGEHMTKHANREGDIVPVGDYAYIMHEHLAPFGEFNLGKKSQEKQDANPSTLVGGKFLERALYEKEKGLVRRIIEKVKTAFD